MPVMISSPNVLMHFSSDGTSMKDFIEAGEDLIVARLFPNEYKLGDVLVFMHPELEKPVAHRLRWIKKLGKSEHLYCLSGDSHPLLYEWIHEDFIRGRVEIVVKKNGQKYLKDFLRSGYHKTFWTSFAPQWIKHQIKLAGIKALEILQSFPPYRRMMNHYVMSAPRFIRYEHSDHLAIEVKIGENYAGRGHLIFSKNQNPEIVNLEIRARYKGMGIGKKILSFLIDEAKKRKARQISLSVWDQSKPALSLYQKLGFEIVAQETISSVGWLAPRLMYKMELKLN